ncbi:uncharacterized protein LTR77_006415 [Saxophila tyrrhenica]|uniref:Survival protein SurE-like phosphatase/nucleotidase domain-containing protein n=1 Tax=Saxophila tyrrhenica TaxID=1690608 RepID=A0AAV9P822_9PEZI|nr:hypothetical protein LTR77_006415 [Saxophila tyrrhenica]
MGWCGWKQVCLFLLSTPAVSSRSALLEEQLPPNMHLPTSLFLMPLAAQAVNVLQSNDDGWAEKNLRVFYYSLVDAGFDSIISAPAENQSGRSSLDAPPTEVDDGCEFNSCPPGSPPTGRNESMPRFNAQKGEEELIDPQYVNSYPVTAMKYGINTLSEEFFGGEPDIAVAGPNVGSNLGIITQFSGTVGAAVEAVKQGIPAIAFSGSSGSQTAWNAPLETYMSTYADLSTTLTQAVVNSGTPYLPGDVFLNVNYPEIGDNCRKPSDFKFVLSRVNIAVPFVTPDDVETCGNDGRLPNERDVIGTDGCYASVSVGDANDKTTAGIKAQRVVLGKLQSILSCLPE